MQTYLAQFVPDGSWHTLTAEGSTVVRFDGEPVPSNAPALNPSDFHYLEKKMVTFWLNGFEYNFTSGAEAREFVHDIMADPAEIEFETVADFMAFNEG